MATIRVFLADEHPIVREGLKVVIGALPRMEIVGEAADGTTAFARIADTFPDIVVMDLSISARNSAEAIATIKGARPKCQVLVFTRNEERNYLRLMFDAGATGYVSKRSALSVLLAAIETVTSGGVYIDSPRLHKGLAPFPRLPQARLDRTGGLLSLQEEEVLKLGAVGYSNKEIAAQLGLSVRTIETFKVLALAKLGFRSRVDTMRFAVEQGWLGRQEGSRKAMPVDTAPSSPANLSLGTTRPPSDLDRRWHG
jgi:two-component system, NarL family, response regulator NreC